jgi:hypothetical protein
MPPLKRPITHLTNRTPADYSLQIPFSPEIRALVHEITSEPGTPEIWGCIVVYDVYPVYCGIFI